MNRPINTNRILSFEQALREATNGKEFLNIGPTPHNENCTQAGINFSDSIFECAVYIRQLKRVYGPAPKGCEFFIMRNQHDFGTYYDVNIIYGIEQNEGNDTDLSPSVGNHLSAQEYALKVECGLDYWDHEATQELIEGDHHLYVARVIKINKSA